MVADRVLRSVGHQALLDDELGAILSSASVVRLVKSTPIVTVEFALYSPDRL